MRKISFLISILSAFLIVGCADELSLSLTVNPNSTVYVGESIFVNAEKSTGSITWYLDGNKHACSNPCEFSSNSATSREVKVEVTAESSGVNSLAGGGTQSLSKSVKLTWEDEPVETTTTTTTTTTTVLATSTTANLSSTLTDVHAGELVIRISGSSLPTSGLTATITGESCGTWALAFQFRSSDYSLGSHSSSEVLLEAPSDCIFTTISSMSQIVLNQQILSSNTVTVQRNTGSSFVNLTTGTF